MPTLDQCPDTAGSLNNPTLPNGSVGNTPAAPPNPYVPPDLCVGDYDLTSTESAAW